MTRTRFWLVVSIVTSGLGCSTLRSSTPLLEPAAISVTGDYRQTASGMSFPTSVGDFTRTALLRYDSGELDVSAAYELNEGKSTAHIVVYVYPATGCTGDGASAESRREFELLRDEALRVHRGAKRLEDQIYTLDQSGKRFSGWLDSIVFTPKASESPDALISQLYLFGCVGEKWTVKYRATYPKQFKAGNKVKEFLQKLRWTIRGA